MIERRRRFTVILAIAVAVFAGSLFSTIKNGQAGQPVVLTTNGVENLTQNLAVDKHKTLAVKGRAPKTGYTREQFGNGWADMGSCDMRNFILKRDMTNVAVKSDEDCTVISGTLDDPYTGTKIDFLRGSGTSSAVQIDHVVALSDAWQKGAQQLAPQTREEFANDPLNLLAVDGPTNIKKGAGDVATWLPPNKTFRCRYIARQIAVKAKYVLWVTDAEHDAMKRVLSSCPTQLLPVVE